MRVRFIALAFFIQASLVGCFQRTSIPEERYQRALSLVDEGTTLLRQRKPTEAGVLFAMAAELAPLAAAVDGQGCAALMEGDLTRAEELFEKAYDMDETYDEALGNLALLKDIQGASQEALKLYARFLEAHPDSGVARNNKAALEYDLGARRILVAQELEKATRLSEHGVIKDNLERLSTTEFAVEAPRS
jgi:tetratricopeptide (TPR) repeat protein